MKSRPVIASLGLLFAVAIAAPAAHAQPASAAIERANADAVARLYASIAAEQVADVPVAQIVEGVGGYTILMNGLGRAEQVGGPRQVADNVFQVRLQISGTRAAQLVLQAVAARPERSPVPPDRLAYHLRMWRDRTFTSTGDNVVVPVAASQPVEATAQTQQAYVAPTTPPPEARPDAPVVWRRPPAWVNQALVAKATAQPAGSQLRTARAAERSAREALRQQIAGLPINGEPNSPTIGDESKARADVASAVDEVVTLSRVVGTDYRADGSVEMRVAGSADRLWQRISMAR